MSGAKQQSETRLRNPAVTSWETVTVHGVRVASVTAEAKERILRTLADYQLSPAPVGESRGGPTFVLGPLRAGGMVAREVALSAAESGLAVLVTFGVGTFGSTATPPANQRLALVSARQLDLARSDSGWVLLNADALASNASSRGRAAG